LHKKTAARSLATLAPCVGVVLAALAAPATQAADWQPTRNVEMVVASGAGGGTDNFARVVQMIITKYKLMKPSTVVVNKGGGNGAEAFLDFSLTPHDPNRIVFGTSNEYMLPLVAKLGYKWDDLTPVAMMAMDDFVLWVNAESPYQTAKAYLDAVKADPDKFRMGGSQSKDTDQILTKLIDKAYGVKFTYIPFKGGGEAATQLVGNHVSSNINNPNENISQWRAGQVRALCVFSPHPMAYTEKIAGGKSWSDIPTCKDAGIPIEQYQMPRVVYMAGGVTPQQSGYYAAILKKVSETPEWKEYLTRNALNGEFLAGKELRDFIGKDEAQGRKVIEEAGWLVK
jgi:putative tricarboxylic transport membrane protein